MNKLTNKQNNDCVDEIDTDEQVVETHTTVITLKLLNFFNCPEKLLTFNPPNNHYCSFPVD